MARQIRNKPLAYRLLRARIQRLGGLVITAKAWRLSPSYLSMIMSGQRPIPDKVLAMIGYERIELLRERRSTRPIYREDGTPGPVDREQLRQDAGLDDDEEETDPCEEFLP